MSLGARLLESDAAEVVDGNSLGIQDAGAFQAEVEALGTREWLVRGLWLQGQYGALGAERKAGKTWAVLDLAVSVATGTEWLNHFPTICGPVLLFVGEGDRQATYRRLDAILRSRGGCLDDLHQTLRIAHRVPRLLHDPDLRALDEEMAAHPSTCLAIIDPFYLSAGGARSSDLNSMGETLGRVQQSVSATGASLLIVPHFNKTGSGSGVDRFTGVGPQEWSRIMGAVAIERRASLPEHPGGSDVMMRWEWMGGEIADLCFRVRRRVWASDLLDPGADLHYECEVTEEAVGASLDGRTPTQKRVLDALGEGSTEAKTIRQIGDALAVDGQGFPLKAKTIERTLKSLAPAYVDCLVENGRPGVWWRVDT